ncbi:sensor histidine kinase [Steroidobacter denitrificans]|uniref:sensor histidine kinase n=1 Tax=Steroidobacter denitrificans TaxID=465721 RepID=UPI000830A901|nr:ATP-binding protein [Steroidobacter denitrificans]
MNHAPVQTASLSDPRLTRLRRSVFAYAGIIAAIAWVYAMASVFVDRQQTRAAARTALLNFATGLNLHTEAVLADGLGSAQAAASHLEAIGGIRHAEEREALRMLRSDLVGGAYVDALFVAAPDRFMAAARGDYREAASRPPEWLLGAFREAPSMFVGTPIPVPVNPAQRVIPIAVRIAAPAGEIRYAGAWFDIEALHRRYERTLPADAVIGLMTENGDILARVVSGAAADLPMSTRISSTERQHILRAVQQQPTILEFRAQAGSAGMMYAVSRPQPAAALLTVVGRTHRSIMASWRERMLKMVIVASISSIMLLLLTLALQHYAKELDRARKALQGANETLEQRVAERTSQLALANERLAAANDELEAFSAAASHDLRSPLTTISGQAGLLELRLNESADPEVRKRLDRIHAGVRGAVEVIDGMLSLARVSRHELACEEVSLSGLVRQCIDDIAEQHGRIDIDSHVQPGLIVMADPRLMKSLVFNLVSNAWKYSVGKPRVRIEFSCEEGHERIYCLRDHGVGFDMAHAGNLFQPFRRLHSATDFPGTGVGLALVARIVNRYGGKIWAAGVVGEGAAFHFTLPLASAA